MIMVVCHAQQRLVAAARALHCGIGRAGLRPVLPLGQTIPRSRQNPKSPWVDAG
jgi:hypothetical protein